MSLDNQPLPQIPGFTIHKTLGSGGMAQVYLATQNSMDREVAIKVLSPQLLVDPSFGERFLREAHISAKLAHPHIVAIIDVGIADGLHYIAMEYQPGGDLSDRIKKGLTEKESVRIIKDIAQALDYAHANGFIHRDIKPDNILFSRSGSTVLSDFGIARAADGDSKLTSTGSVIGTPHYMSPEQAMGTPLDGRADLYSLGIMFYQLLVGTVPFSGDSAMSIGIKHIRDPIPKLPAHLVKYEAVIDKLLAKDPEDRWKTAADVIRALEIVEIKESPADSNHTLAGTAINSIQSTVLNETQANPALSARTTKSKVPLTMISVVVLTIIVTGVLLLPKLNTEEKPDQAQATASINPTPAAPPVKVETADTKNHAAKTTTPGNTAVKKIEPKPQAKVANPEAKPAPKQEVIQEIKTNPLNDYLANAKNLLVAARLSETRLKAATREYKQAYNLAPTDPRVKDLLIKIANGYEIIADEIRLNKNWVDARRLANDGLALVPDHRGLKNLVTKVDVSEQAAKAASSPSRVFGGF